MVLPMTLFTPEDLLLYLYKESSPELTNAIETALNEDWTLREKMQVLHASVEQLDKITIAPSVDVILKVLNYARNTAPAESISNNPR
jgi:hypothetical protein